MRALYGPAAIALIIVVGACAEPAASVESTARSSPTLHATPTPTVTPTPTAEPAIATPPPTAEAAEGGWATTPGRPMLIGRAVRSTVDRLNVRQRPWLSASIEGVVTPDDVLEVLSPPYDADGYIWHHVVVRGASGSLPDLPRHLGGAGEPLFGWVAVRTGDTRYVDVLDPRCPDRIEIRYVSAMLGGERVACFGSDWVEIEGVWEGCFCTWPTRGTYLPDWLAHPDRGGRLARDPNEGINGVWLHFPPNGPDEPEKGAIVRARIHFDDDRATTCEITVPYDWNWDVPDAPAHSIGATSSERTCRQQAVVDSYEVIGTYTGEWPDID